MPLPSLSILAFLWIALTGCTLGSAVVRRLAPRELGAGWRALLAWAVGLPLLAYATLGMGLLGQLSAGKLAGMLVVAGALGLVLGGGRELACQGEVLRRAGRALARSPQRVWYGLVALWGLTLVPQALAPPGYVDWDGPAEHLAMAKVWLHGGAIVPLWYDHHSQFPATVQMLYVLGLAFGGPVAAKLFTTLFGLLSVAAVGAVARRHFGRESGAWALVIFAATPLVGWLSTVAYVDLPAVFFCMLGLSFFLDWQQRPGVASAAWAGVCFGLGLAVKMQVLVFWGALLLVALGRVASVRVAPASRRCRGQGQDRLTGETPVPPRPPTHWRQWAAYVGLALAVASPWYVKSWVLTGNQVYPFAYGIFGGKQWSPEQAQAYTYAQKRWGWGDLPPGEVYWKLSPLQRLFVGPRRPDHLLLAPVGLTFLPAKYVDAGWGRVLSFMCTAVGPLYLALLPLLLLRGKRPRAWGVIGWALVPVWLWWLISAQYSRYFLPGLAWLAPAAAWAAGEVAQRGRWARWVLPGVVMAGLAVAIGINLLGAAAALPVLTGTESADDYLSTVQTGLYPALQFLNRVTPENGTVISYGEPRLFYLDRPYLWGEPNYHRLLDYDRMETADDLLAAYRGLGITEVLTNRQFFPGGPPINQKIAKLLEEGVVAGKLEVLAGPPGLGPYVVLAVVKPHP